MRTVWHSICLLTAVVLFSPVALAEDPATDIFKGPVDARLDALAKVQPGLGTVMTEYGNRFVDVYYAAKGGNWGLAQYQLKEMLEIQEVGEATRPAKAPLLKSFEEGYLLPLEKTISAKQWKKFDSLYRDAADGCNGCHAATDHEFIHFRLPAKPVEAYLDFTVKTDPTGKWEEK